ncbi:hypothetical protein SMB34_12245 [Thalassospira permensis NBRC 106175]|uniref:Uncharacterized protein n=1 Tax=Thalassospira permensis NBRC 106175 TaxID=1353532 RepID=A0ABR4TTD5_9PROT|nr:hypothetical protein SMB34_12245 [Thalassospira permensis NBRC 106175]
MLHRPSMRLVEIWEWSGKDWGKMQVHFQMAMQSLYIFHRKILMELRAQVETRAEPIISGCQVDLHRVELPRQLLT